jgi:hypothetical protein
MGSAGSGADLVAVRSAPTAGLVVATSRSRAAAAPPFFFAVAPTPFSMSPRSERAAPKSLNQHCFRVENRFNPHL